MRQIVALLIAVAVFAATFFVTSLVSQYTMNVEMAGHTFTGSIPGLALALMFAILSFRGGGKS